MRHCLPLGFLLLVLGCASTESPIGSSEGGVSSGAGKYFRREILYPGADFSKYQKVQVLPPSADYLKRERPLGDQDLNSLRWNFVERMMESLGRDYEILLEGQSADRDTLVIHSALTEIEPPSSLVHTTGTLIRGPLTSGHVSFEAKMKDGFTGELLAEVGERRSGMKGLQSLMAHDYQKYSHAQAIFGAWAEQMRKFLKERIRGS